MPLHYLDSEHWRERAAHMRLLSLEVKDAEAAAVMQKLADDYDELADRAVRQAAVSDPRNHPESTHGVGR